METFSAADNPEVAAAAAQEVLRRAENPPEESQSTPPKVPVPEDCAVTLPGGYVVLRDGQAYRDAVVRELDGNDEEAIARVAGNFSKTLDLTLQRGVVSVGPYPADKAVLDGLLMGDRDALLVAIRRVTFGDEIEFNELTCPACNVEQSPTVSIKDDIPVTELENAYDNSVFDLTLKTGVLVQVALPTGSVQRALASLNERTEAAMNTELLSKCVKSINGFPSVSREQVRSLKVKERQEIIKEIADRNPGPQLGEVKQPCSACGEDIPLPLSLAALFLG